MWGQLVDRGTLPDRAAVGPEAVMEDNHDTLSHLKTRPFPLMEPRVVRRPAGVGCPPRIRMDSDPNSSWV
jgi:hypothetical protein